MDIFRFSDGQWEQIEPLLPPESASGGRPSKPHRPMLEAIFWQARSGRPWRELPSAYGPWQSVYTRFTRWARAGILERIGRALEHAPPSPPRQRPRAGNRTRDSHEAGNIEDGKMRSTDAPNLGTAPEEERV